MERTARFVVSSTFSINADHVGRKRDPMKNLIVVALMAAVLAGCAMTTSTFDAKGSRNPDGTSSREGHARKTVMSTIGKNVSDLESVVNVEADGSIAFQDGVSSDHDTTALVPVIQALVAAFTAQQTQQQGNTPSALSRIEQLQNQIEALRTLVETLRRP